MERSVKEDGRNDRIDLYSERYSMGLDLYTGEKLSEGPGDIKTRLRNEQSQNKRQRELSRISRGFIS